MIWDEFPDVLRDDAVEAAASQAASLEGQDEPLTSVADAFKQHGEEARSTNNDAGLALIADGLACHLRLTYVGDDRERWGAFGPMMEIGGGAYPPPLPTFPDALRSYFQRRATESTRADLRARYNDLLWVRWKDFPAARRAHAAYLEASRAGDLDDSSSSMPAVELLLRAVTLAFMLHIEEDATIERLRSEIMRGLPHDTPGYASWLAREGADLLARQPETARALVDAMSTEAANAPSGRRHRERSYLDAAEAIARASGDAERANELRRASARSYEAEARERAEEGGLIELALLNDAVQLYGQVGAGEDVQRLKHDLAAASLRAEEGLHTVSTDTFTVPHEEFEKAADDLIARYGEDDPVLLLAMGDSLGLWPEPERVEASLDQAMNDHPLLYLFGHTTVTGDGRYQPDPPNEAERREAHITRHYAQDVAIKVGIGGPVIDVLRHRGQWSADRLTAAVSVVEPEIAEASDAGFRALEGGEPWSAMHVLIPQLERAVRAVVVAKGGAPMSQAERSSGLRWKSLDESLRMTEAIEGLGQGVASGLRRLFVDPYGPNYRNEIAHGAADPKRGRAQDAMLSALALLSVTLRLAIIRRPSDSHKAS